MVFALRPLFFSMSHIIVKSDDVTVLVSNNMLRANYCGNYNAQENYFRRYPLNTPSENGSKRRWVDVVLCGSLGGPVWMCQLCLSRRWRTAK